MFDSICQEVWRESTFANFKFQEILGKTFRKFWPKTIKTRKLLIAKVSFLKVDEVLAQLDSCSTLELDLLHFGIFISKYKRKRRLKFKIPCSCVHRRSLSHQHEIVAWQRQQWEDLPKHQHGMQLQNLELKKIIQGNSNVIFYRPTISLQTKSQRCFSASGKSLFKFKNHFLFVSFFIMIVVTILLVNFFFNKFLSTQSSLSTWSCIKNSNSSKKLIKFKSEH